MEYIIDYLKFMAVLSAIVIVIFIVLLSLPNSKLRQSILKIYSICSFVVTIISALYIVSPADLIPDVIPVAGQGDDFVALISGLITAITGYFSWQKSKSATENNTK